MTQMMRERKQVRKGKVNEFTVMLSEEVDGQMQKIHKEEREEEEEKRQTRRKKKTVKTKK